MIIHLIDGTYELFRHFYGIRRFRKTDPPLGAVTSSLHMIIESFRNHLWPGYKTGEGIEPALYAQFIPLEEFLGAMGVVVWPMIEFEADDALAAAAHVAAEDTRVEKVCIWTPDKDLAQCVVDDRVVQMDRRSGQMRNEQMIYTKFGVAPAFIPDYLALVGDSADGYPGVAGFGRKTAATLINRYGHIEQFPEKILGESLQQALLFKDLATLRIEVPLGGVESDVERLRWRGPASEFASMAERLDDPRLMARIDDLAKQM
jgi:5'-3' exonuclease